ncbi:MAG: hypothetical protein JWO82_1095, partial [Akkermansiaceae bacterium]|nr:hypothetical protein [Akkermansiaceae bacterium]
GLLFMILPAPDPATGLAAGQFIVPGECIVPISAAGSPVRYLSSTDEQTLIYGLQRSKPGSIEIDAYSLVPRLGPRHYDSLDRVAGEKIARSKLGRRLFPQGVELLNSRVAGFTARTVTITATASPASIGGQKSLSCTLQLQPDTDATVKLLHWHLSEK